MIFNNSESLTDFKMNSLECAQMKVNEFNLVLLSHHPLLDFDCNFYQRIMSLQTLNLTIEFVNQFMDK
jgi:hypothetical protein